MIDTTKPMELTDGTPVDYSHTTRYGYIIVHTPSLPYGGSSGFTERVFRRNGQHVFESLPDLRNVRDGINWTKPIQTRDGRPVELIAEPRGTVSGKAVVQFSPGLGMASSLHTVFSDGRVVRAKNATSCDDIVNVSAAITKRFTNVYADGSVGSTKHTTFNNAHVHSKYGKTRVGILEQHFQNGGIITARIVPTSPKLRTASSPNGSNPFS